MTSWNSGPNFGALETAQQSKGIPEGDLPGQSGIFIVGSFLSHVAFFFHEKSVIWIKSLLFIICMCQSPFMYNIRVRQANIAILLFCKTRLIFTKIVYPLSFMVQLLRYWPLDFIAVTKL
jgi:hypothetical protein